MLKHIVFILTTCFISSCLADRKAYIIDNRRELFALHHSHIPTYLFLDADKTWYKTELFLNNQGKVEAKILDNGKYTINRDSLFLHMYHLRRRTAFYRFIDNQEALIKPEPMTDSSGIVILEVMGSPKPITDKKTTRKIWKALKNEGAAGSGANQ